MIRHCGLQAVLVEEIDSLPGLVIAELSDGRSITHRASGMKLCNAPPEDAMPAVLSALAGVDWTQTTDQLRNDKRAKAAASRAEMVLHTLQTEQVRAEILAVAALLIEAARDLEAGKGGDIEQQHKAAKIAADRLRGSAWRVKASTARVYSLRNDLSREKKRIKLLASIGVVLDRAPGERLY